MAICKTLVILICVLGVANLWGQEPQAGPKQETKPEANSASTSRLQAILGFVPRIEEIKRDKQAKLPASHWQQSLEEIRKGIAKKFPKMELKQDYRGEHGLQHLIYRQGSDAILLTLDRCNTPREAGEHLRRFDQQFAVRTTADIRVQGIGDEAYVHGTPQRTGTFHMCYSNVHVIINASSRELQLTAANIIIDGFEKVAKAAKRTDSTAQIAAPPSTRQMLDAVLAGDVDDVFSLPTIDEIKRGRNAKLPVQRWPAALEAIRTGVAKEFVSMTLKEDSRGRSDARESQLLRYRHNDSGLDIHLWCYNTPREAGEALRVTDRSVSMKRFSLRPGDEFRLEGIGDEAYQYFPNGTVIMCYSNVFVLVKGQPADIKTRAAKVIAGCLKKVAEDASSGN